jgi:magnesium chelatase family protein
LFLDELPEFSRQALEVLREPLESGQVTLSRARHKVTYPARFQLVAAMNPCPCGYLGDSDHRCRCSTDQVQRYRQRISGPLLDRIDLHVSMPRLPAAELLGGPAAAESSTQVRQRVDRARSLQAARQGCANALLPAPALAQHCSLGRAEQRQLESAATRMRLSARGLHRTLRVARTIADLAGDPDLAATHLGEALAYREAGVTA